MLFRSITINEAMEVYQNHKNDNDKNHIYDIGYYGFLASKANTKKGVFLLASSFKIKKCPYKKKKAKKKISSS